MSIRDSYYFALLEVHNGRPISVKTCFKGQQGDLTTLSRTVAAPKAARRSLRPNTALMTRKTPIALSIPSPPGSA